VVILEFELKTELYTSPDLLEDKFDSPWTSEIIFLLNSFFAISRT
jgi:hypothetical protein